MTKGLSTKPWFCREQTTGTATHQRVHGCVDPCQSAICPADSGAVPRVSDETAAEISEACVPPQLHGTCIDGCVKNRKYKIERSVALEAKSHVDWENSGELPCGSSDLCKLAQANEVAGRSLLSRMPMWLPTPFDIDSYIPNQNRGPAALPQALMLLGAHGICSILSTKCRAYIDIALTIHSPMTHASCAYTIGLLGYKHRCTCSLAFHALSWYITTETMVWH